MFQADYEFVDLYGEKWSIQESSLATQNAIWLGVDEVTPKILASRLDPKLTGWLPYVLPDGVLLNGRMHLSQRQAADLVKLLQGFVATGELN